MKRIQKSVIFSLSVLVFILLCFSVKNYSFDVTIKAEKPTYDKGATVKITSSETMRKVKIYKKISNNKYILFFVGKPNSKELVVNIPNSLLSEESKTEIKVVATNNKGETGTGDVKIDKKSARVSMNPEETAKPSWTPVPIPTKPTPSIHPSEVPGPTGSDTIDEIKLNKNSITLKVGEKEKLTYTVKPEGKHPSLTWRTDANEICSIDADGTVTGKAVGEATISIKASNGVMDICMVKVEEGSANPSSSATPTGSNNPNPSGGTEITAIKLNKNSVNLKVGQTDKLTYTVTPEGAHPHLIWRTEANDICSIEADGTIKGVSVGVCEISIRADNGVKDVCTVTVTSNFEEPNRDGVHTESNEDNGATIDTSNYGNTLARGACELSYSSYKDSDGKDVVNKNGYYGTKLYVKYRDDGNKPHGCCSRGMSTVVNKYLKLDTDLAMTGAKEQYGYMAKSDKWKKIGNYKSGMENDSDSPMKPGDIVISTTHTCMYVGNEIPTQVYNEKLKGTDADMGPPSKDAVWVSGGWHAGLSLCICKRDQAHPSSGGIIYRYNKENTGVGSIPDSQKPLRVAHQKNSAERVAAASAFAGIEVDLRSKTSSGDFKLYHDNDHGYKLSQFLDTCKNNNQLAILDLKNTKNLSELVSFVNDRGMIDRTIFQVPNGSTAKSICSYNSNARCWLLNGAGGSYETLRIGELKNFASYIEGINVCGTVVTKSNCKQYIDEIHNIQGSKGKMTICIFAYGSRSDVYGGDETYKANGADYLMTDLHP